MNGLFGSQTILSLYPGGAMPREISIAYTSLQANPWGLCARQYLLESLQHRRVDQAQSAAINSLELKVVQHYM